MFSEDEVWPMIQALS
jgi:hypothetical protein